MHGWLTSRVGAGVVASMVGCTALLGQAAPDVCSLASGAEFQEAAVPNPQIVIPPGEPVATPVGWGAHCDYDDGSVDFFTKKSPAADLDRLLELMKGGKQRASVPGLGQRAFFTTIYPDDQYRRRGLIAVFLGPRLVTISMDPNGDEPLEATRSRLERLAKLVLPRLK